jgi:hypothetical protein
MVHLHGEGRTMAVIDTLFNNRFDLQPATRDKLRRDFSAAAWKWYNEHAEDTVFSRRILFFTIHIKVKDCFDIFVQLFGPQPLL